MSDKNLNEWLFADMEDLIDCNYDEESVADIKMTYEEAKNLIDDITWKYNGNSITNETICKCRNKCREALEKQIPKKPIINERKIQCVNEHNQPVQHYKYCPMCGQLMDWSDA